MCVAVGGVVFGFILWLIGWGIWEMRGSHKSRDASIKALADIGAGIQELLTRKGGGTETA